jgi:hypothetical protein
MDVGVYIPPSENDNSTINMIQKATIPTTKSSTKIPITLLGYLNIDIKKEVTQSTHERQMETMALISSLSVYDLDQHFVQKRIVGFWT